MIAIAGLIIGALIGVAFARRKNGNRLDIAQYAGVFALIFFVIGLFITVMIDRMV